MGTLNHVGVAHLFLVPNIRTSKYLSLLTDACPEIRNSPNGCIQAEELPHLKVGRKGENLLSHPANIRIKQHIIVVDNIHDRQQFQRELDSCESAIDFRGILIKNQSSWEERERKTLQTSLDKHDVINLQFTRYQSRHSAYEEKRANQFLFTSGTTGYPKAVSLTHHNLLNNALSIGDCMRLTEQDVLCNVPPLFHCFDK